MVFSQTSGTEATEPFIATQRVPMGTSSSSTPSITISGYFDQGGLRSNIEPVSTIIVILQYYKIAAFTEEIDVRINPGENGELDLRIVNLGNGYDDFIIDFENRDTLHSDGFKLPPPQEVPMEEEDNRTISLEIGAPEGGSGSYLVEISISSKGSLDEGNPVKVVKTIKVKVGGITDRFISLITSPLAIIIIIIVIVAALFVAMNNRKKIRPTKG
jgi:uncharacterized membrane protein